MSKSKQDNIKELLEALENDKTPVSKEDTLFLNDPILAFVHAFKIQRGTRQVSSKLLFKLFRLWNPSIKIQQRDFNIKLSTYLPYFATKNYYRININMFKIANSIEKLLDKKSTDKTKSKTYHKRFEAFLLEHNLEEGLFYIEADILYYVYNRWCDKKKRAAFGYTTFNDMCTLYFDRKRIHYSKLIFYGVNENIKNIVTKEEVTRWRQGRAKYGKRKHTEETKFEDGLVNKTSNVVYKEEEPERKKKLSSS
jgi:hypothetical protein